MHENTWFRKFHDSIYMSSYITDKVRYRYEKITQCINQEYWDSNSRTDHSLYVGSYGRGTAIYTSDIDIIVELPRNVRQRFDNRLGNKQSQLLSEVKDKLSKTYSSSKISADGQVVDIEFSDDIKFEVVPCFKWEDFWFEYPDTNNGGRWRQMFPAVEMKWFNDRHREHNYTMKKFCRMLRCWREQHQLDISGELLDTFVYEFYLTANYTDEEPYLYFDFLTRDFFNYLSNNILHQYWSAPGGGRQIELDNKLREKIKRNADEMKEYAYQAIHNNGYDEMDSKLAKLSWERIYGRKFVN